MDVARRIFIELTPQAHLRTRVSNVFVAPSGQQCRCFGARSFSPLVASWKKYLGQRFK
jgi:hypothetical protein